MTKSTLTKVKGHFLLGHLQAAKDEGVYFYLRMNREHGYALSIRLAHKNLMLFTHPDHNKEVLVDKADQFIKGEQYDSLRILMGNGLLTSIGPTWNRQRRMLNPIFGKEGMDILLHHIDRISKKYSEQCPLNEEMNWTKYMFDFTIEVAFASFFGSSFDDSKRGKLIEASYDCVQFVSKRMSRFINVPVSIPTSDQRKFKRSYTFLKNTVGEIYEKRKLNPNPSDKDLLDLLISAKDSEGAKDKLTQAEIWDQILSFMIAGHETTALTMSWLFYHLAQRKDVQDKIAEECRSNNFEFSDSLALSNYPYLNAVLNETMRLYPPGWILARTAVEDSSVGDIAVKKGQIIAVSPLVSQRDPQWWNRPDEFIPERFLQGHELFHKAPKNAHIPFSIGKRNCIGSRFAMLEMATFCIRFFENKRLMTEQRDIRMKAYITLKSSKNILVKVQHA